MKHTPGPWRIIPIEDNKRTHQGALHIFPTEGSPVASVRSVNVRHPRPQAVADAQLIAAAPDLLAALKDAIELFGVSNPDQNSWQHVAAAAIAKAEEGK